MIKKQIVKGLIKGLAGVDANRDGKITTEELVTYLTSLFTTLAALLQWLF